VETDTAGRYPSPAGQRRPHLKSSIEVVEENLWLSYAGISSYDDTRDHGSRPSSLVVAPRNRSPRR
jgi:hypothetical protein